MSPLPPLERTDLDCRIWDEELDGFVPQRVFDVHTHIYRWASYTDPEKGSGPYRRLLGDTFAEATWELADACDELLLPGRTVHRLSFPFPFPPPCDFEASNEFLAREVRKDPQSAGLMLVHPAMGADHIEQQIERHGFVGLKPYRFYATSGDAVNCAITDFLPESQIAVADRRGLVIMMHLSKRDAIADPDNLRDLQRLCDGYAGARWILAHCARSYSAWAIDRAASLLRTLGNVWYDTSSVCESDAIDALLSGVGPERVMYGSDDIPVGMLRGKYVAFGYAWAYLSETNHALNLSHCDCRMTFTRYEQLRAMHRATRRVGLKGPQIDALFHDTAWRLIESARASSGNRGAQPPMRDRSD
jgi:glutamate-1-semialdehyde 2,1-aminomutase